VAQFKRLMAALFDSQSPVFSQYNNSTAACRDV
jgi:hypothetical protein